MRYLALITLSCTCLNAEVSQTFVNKVKSIESGGRNISGDNGSAAGTFQIWEACWLDISKLRAKAGLPVYDYSMAYSPVVSRIYATTWLNHIETMLTKSMNRKPTQGEIYAAYNLGLSGFRSRDFSLLKCPATTRRAASLLDSTPN